MFIRRTRRGPLIAVFFGVIAFANVSRNPRFTSLHTVDVLQLLLSGIFLGFALGAVIAMRRAEAPK